MLLTFSYMYIMCIDHRHTYLKSIKRYAKHAKNDETEKKKSRIWDP